MKQSFNQELDGRLLYFHQRCGEMHFSLMVVCLFCFGGALPARNVCNHIDDYDNIEGSDNCWYDLDVDSTVPELIANYGYSSETYNVTTRDGYILTLFRVKKGAVTGGQPIFLQHGIVATCAMFLLNGNNSLAFLLTDAGYDVWLGNARGSQLSRGHVKYSAADSAFWDFSFHEMAMYDIPSTLNLINKVTRRNDTIYIGHSMGTAIAYAYASNLPQHASQRLKLIVALAPAIFMGNMRSPIKMVANYSTVIQNLALASGFHEVSPHNPYLYKQFCLGTSSMLSTCRWIYFALFGMSPNQFKPELFPRLFSFYPAGTSVKNVAHFAQSVLSDKFRQYDYGTIMNLAYYNSLSPPEYNLSRVPVPSIIIYSENDYISSVQNVLRLNNTLFNVAKLHKLEEQFNHMDFLIGRDSKEVVSNKIIEFLVKYNS